MWRELKRRNAVWFSVRSIFQAASLARSSGERVGTPV